ncbi:MAG: GreA/GreB family elongation factor [Candidatus Wildermuthbacteria bacterium]|nr:GreA/GreB family elongation factor [Candidatus Wildermuthbacteria bacterium]
METTYHLTSKGLEALRKEYEGLLELKKIKTTGDDVPSILHSEEANPEYLSFQEDMVLLEGRIADLENIFKNAVLIAPPTGEEKKKIGLGAIVTVDLGGEVDEFTIVGTLEADPLRKKISNESPLGRGLLGMRAGDMVKVKTALINHDCKILKISYL